MPSLSPLFHQKEARRFLPETTLDGKIIKKKKKRVFDFSKVFFGTQATLHVDRHWDTECIVSCGVRFRKRPSLDSLQLSAVRSLIFHLLHQPGMYVRDVMIKKVCVHS